ncbi:hypothetical protein GCM10025865_31500 [Paraoerskovia sediminicola]|uniref:Transglutaminase-like domain-containing protein n=1 Tax=Paraoerskovia sediminicola TaxID=1138587 RepID=A0ABN6XGA4_9CELL|nr:DUF3488 and transglutaminase-like domain-containing protein [Paraoerskovia sediminicola]BDZ43851.1 hypothetical protein GCM10025865_31500 [Paraoerskovia sediminicola]
MGARADLGLDSSWSQLFATEGRSVRLSDDLDMLRNLGPRSDDVVLTYTTGEGDDLASPLRVYTATAFDGTRWSRGSSSGGVQFSDDEVLWPEDPGDDGEAARIDVTLENFRDSLLPITTDPRRVLADGRWVYSDDRDQVQSESPNDQGYTYAVETYVRPLDPESLRAAEGPDPDDDRYLEVPETSSAEQVAELARSITADETTRYDQALTLQTYLRDTTRFTYSTEVPSPDADDAVWTFLQDRTGYCVQFATAMTVMARDLGIPARLAVGFLPGRRDIGTSTYEVTGRRSHAWPELYFPGSGWVRFEPTPSIQTGPAPGYADPLLQGGAVPTQVPEPVPSAETTDASAEPEESSAAPTLVEAADPGASDSQQSQRWSVLLLAAGGVLLVGAAVVLALRRRQRRHEPVRSDAERTWTEVRSRLGAMAMDWPESVPPGQVPAWVSGEIFTRTGRDAPEDLVEEVANLGRIVADERYAQSAGTVDRATLDTLASTIVSGVADELSARPPHADGPTAPRGARGSRNA